MFGSKSWFGSAYSEMLKIIHAHSVAEEVQESIVQHASMSVPADKLVSIEGMPKAP